MCNLGELSVVTKLTRFCFGDLLIRYTRILLAAVVMLSASTVLPAQQKSEPTKDSDEIYKVGGDVKPPKVTHYVEPDTSSQDGFVDGVVRISAVVNLDGAPSDLLVVKGLSQDEDKLAMEALKQWRFSPGTKSGKPVRVKINVEIAFHLL